MTTLRLEDRSTGDLIAEVKATVSMWDLFNQLEIDHPTPSGRGVKISTRDENVPSCHVYDDHWYDFGTGEGGDVIDFFRRFGGGAKAGFRDSLLLLLNGEFGTGRFAGWVPERSPEEISEQFVTGTSPIREASERDDFLREAFIGRKWAPLTIETLSWARIRATKWSVLVPHYDWEGAFRGEYRNGKLVNVLGVKVRNVHGPGTSSIRGSRFGTQLWSPFLTLVARVAASTNVPDPVEFWKRYREGIRHLVVCEGESDTLTVHQFLHHPLDGSPGTGRVIVAGLPSGASIWRPEWLASVGEGVTLHVIVDGDGPGTRSGERILDTNPKAIIYRAIADARADLEIYRNFDSRGVRMHEGFWPDQLKKATQE